MPFWTLPERAQRGWTIRPHTGRLIAQMPDGALYFESAYYPFTEDEENRTMTASKTQIAEWIVDRRLAPRADRPRPAR